VAYFGIARVSLDNRFAEYFDTDTEIYQGMYYLDTKLGGTIPFDVVVRFPPYEDLSFGADDELEEDIFATEEEDEYPERYWFTREKLDDLEKRPGEDAPVPGIQASGGEGIILYGPGGLRPGVY
jgi:hypothetical protein